jgi:hypothetical protein
VKNGFIFAHKSTARGRLDLEYLDETSGRKATLRAAKKLDEEVGRKLKGFVDYASKESIGQVHAGGFLHNAIRRNSDGTSTAPSKLSNEERKRRITEAWRFHLDRFRSQAKSPVIAHRLVFSMSTEQHDALVKAGISPDQVVISSVRKVMDRFAEKFHPGDSIGYAYGLHHDTDNLHVHVALCPRSAKGRYVGCSMSRHPSKHKNQMVFMREWFERENQLRGEFLSNNEKVEESLTKRLDQEKFAIVPRLSTAQRIALMDADHSAASHLRQSYESILGLEKAIAEKKKQLALLRAARAAERVLRVKKNPLLRAGEKLGVAAQSRSLRQMQQTLTKLKRTYLLEHQHYNQHHQHHAHHRTQPQIQQHSGLRL